MAHYVMLRCLSALFLQEALYSRDSFEETKSWLRKLIRRKVLSDSNAAEYKAIVEKLGLKLNGFINSTKA